MNTPPNLDLEWFFKKAIDFGERIFFLLLYAIFVKSLWSSITSQPYNILALISEGLIVFFTIVRRDAQTISTRPGDWLIALLGTALPLLVKPGGHHIAPLIVGSASMVIGLTISFSAKLTLRRSFGLAAANRGVVEGGPYRIVRHPIYAGYILMYIGFLLNNFMVWNFILYLATIGLLILRVMAEEIVLKQDPRYQTLTQRVHFRLMPGVF